MDFVFLIFFIILLFVYFLPTFIAEIRNIKNSTAVLWLNFFLGWTFLGFLLLLFYASLTSDIKKTNNK
ncbi:MAG: superinfection immunity protein [Pelagibacteraceae bacterium]|nr:MAG: superinfection immunity protein [alpha proteobacterium HIMB114]|tara:strand:+ start:57 stop:260 length:204 start_codon:yes stop_codon:yes gene_type:complete